MFLKKPVNVDLPTFGAKAKTRVVYTEEAPDILKQNDIKGILGWDVISLFDWNVDFSTKTLSIIDESNADQRQYKQHHPSIPLGAYDCFILDEVSLGDGVIIDSVEVDLDFGYSGFLYIYDERLVDFIHHDHMKIASSASIMGSSIDTSSISVTDLKLGNFSMIGAPVSYNHGNNKSKSLMGLKFLEKFGSVNLMYSSNTIEFEPVLEFTHEVSSISIYDGVITSMILNNEELDRHDYQLLDSVESSQVTMDTLSWNVRVKM